MKKNPIQSSRDHLRSRIFLGSLIASVLLSVVIGYFARGGLHGLYADDYVYKLFGSDLASSTWTPTLGNVNYRLLSIFIASHLANSLPELELPIRIGIALLHLANVVLLSGLGYRLTRSHLVALVSGALFLLPIFANQAILWFSGAVFYSTALFLVLLGFHLVLNCRRLAQDFSWLIAGIVLWLASVLFVEAGFFVFLILPVFIVLAHRGDRGSHRVWVVALAVTYLVLGAYGLFVLRTSKIVAVHGQTSLDPGYIVSERVPATLSSFLNSFAGPEVASALPQTVKLGWSEWLTSGIGVVLLGGLVLALISATVFYRPAIGEENLGRRSLWLCLTGFAWVALSIAPVLFIVDLTLTSRTLLFPSAGLALGLAGLVGSATNALGRWRGAVARLALVLAGAVLVFSALSMAGLQRVYQLRWARDQLQLAALRTALPTLPDQVIWFMPSGLDEASVSPVLGENTLLDQYLLGLFQIPWAAEPALRLAYKHGEINVVDRDEHGKLHLKGLILAEGGQVKTITFEGASQRQEVPIARLIAFTYKSGRLIVYDSLVLVAEDGSRTEVKLPLAAQVALPDTPRRSATFNLESAR